MNLLKKFKIASYEEYLLSKEYGIDPLLINRTFKLNIKVRIDIQNELFKSDIMFYKYCWNNMPHFCEESGIKIIHYSAVHISHILSRGAFPEMRYDPRNVNILTLENHHKWESDKKVDMYIYKKNLKRIKLLKTEYYNQHN